MKAWNKFCCALASLVLLMGSLAAPAFAYGAETDPASRPGTCSRHGFCCGACGRSPGDGAGRSNPVP